MLKSSAAIAVALLAVSQPASSEHLYRCEDGKAVTYSDRQCFRGIEKRVILDAPPPTAVISAASERLRQKVEERAAKVALTREPQRAGSTSSADPANVAVACDPRGEEGKAEQQVISVVLRR